MLIAVFALVVSGCGGGKSKNALPTNAVSTTTQAPKNANGVLASEPIAARQGPARIDLVSLDRGPANTVTLRLRFVSTGSGSVSLGGLLRIQDAASVRGTNDDTNIYDINGVLLVDGAANKAYHPLQQQDSEHSCVCSAPAFNQRDATPDKPLELYSVFPAPPGDVSRIDVAVPLAPTFTDIPIGAGPAVQAPGQTIDVATATLRPPEILPLLTTVEGHDRSIDEDDNNERVRLSADVLFATNQSTLTSAAQSALTDVAHGIDASKGTTVTVDGYTDSTGNDAINNPLSQRRAQAVEDALKGLVTRQGVTYNAAGHGSADPVADNNSDAGRQQNRRVAVTYAKPVPPPPVSVPPPATNANDGTLGTSESTKTAGLKATINSLHRDASGLVTMTWTVKNGTSQKQFLSGAFSYDWQRGLPWDRGYAGSGVFGMSLLDQQKGLRYSPLRDSNQTCLCSQFLTIDANADLDPGESAVYYNTFEVPAGTNTVEIDFPNTEYGSKSPEYPPISNVAIRS